MLRAPHLKKWNGTDVMSLWMKMAVWNQKSLRVCNTGMKISYYKQDLNWNINIFSYTVSQLNWRNFLFCSHNCCHFVQAGGNKIAPINWILYSDPSHLKMFMSMKWAVDRLKSWSSLKIETIEDIRTFQHVKPRLSYKVSSSVCKIKWFFKLKMTLCWDHQFHDQE